MKRWIAAVAVTLVATLGIASSAQAHTAGTTWSAPNKSSWSCAEAKYILSADYFGRWWTLQGQPVKMECVRQINAGAWVIRTWHLCSGYYCQAQGVHDWTFDWDASRTGYRGPVFSVVGRHL